MQVSSRREALLGQAAADLMDAGNPDLLARWQPVVDWMGTRLDEGLDTTCKATTARIGTRALGRDRAGRGISGLNLAMRDGLSIAGHPTILAAVSTAAQRFGVHAGGTSAQMGLSTLTTTLEEQLAQFLGCEEVAVFPCGWTAGYGVLRTLLHERDHALLLGTPRECLRDGAIASGARVHTLPHADAEALERRLDRLREQDPQSGVLVLVSALSPHERDLPDMARLQRICRRYAAFLLVDVARDLGLMGETGRGVLEMQQMLGQVDIVLGSFARAFACNGGFVGARRGALKLALRLFAPGQFDSNAISPLQAAAGLAALDLICSEDGAARRARLAANALRLREGLEAQGFVTTGQPGPVVTVTFPRPSQARQLTAELQARGVLVHLEERIGNEVARWHLSPMAYHTFADIDAFLETLELLRRDLTEGEERGWQQRHAAVVPL